MNNPNALNFYKKISEDASMFYIPHHLFLSQNLHRNSADSEMVYKQFPYKSTLPIPVSFPTAAKMEDPVCQYTYCKDSWKNKIRLMKSAYKNLLKRNKINDITLNYTGSTNVPLYLLKFTRLLKDDPDLYFDSNYNWYLSGNGNLCLKNISGDTYLLKSSQNELSVKAIDLIANIDGCENSEKYICKNKELIHETVIQEISQKNIIGLRQKHKIHLIKLEASDENIILKHYKTLHSDIPLTSFAFDNVCNSMYHANANGSIQMYDMEVDKSIDIVNNIPQDKVVNNWSSIQLFDTNSILQTSRDCIRILNKRNQHNESIQITPAFKMGCENMTVSKICSNKPNFLFLGTVHNLYICDVRYLKTETFVAKWSHGLKSSPLFISSEQLDDREITSVHSQLSEDSSIVSHSFGCSTNNEMATDNTNILNNWTDSECYFPWRLPSIQQTLENAQKMGYCLDPTINLKKRFHMSRTGTIFHRSGDNLNLLTLNSVGDVFSQTFYSGPSEPFDESSYSKINSWADQLYQDRLPFIVSSQINMNYLQRTMKRKSQLMERRRTRSKRLLAHNKHWKKSLGGLNDYADMWANELLGVWELDATTNKIDNLIPPPADTKFKIDTWMDQFSLYDD